MLNAVGHTFGAVILVMIAAVFILLALASAIRALEHGQVSKFFIEAILIGIAAFLLISFIKDAMPWAFSR